MRCIASAIVVHAGAILFGAGIIGRAISNNAKDVADSGVVVGILLGLSGLILLGMSSWKEGKG
jgi:hypothetical protein